jgi:hypothetical protein
MLLGMRSLPYVPLPGTFYALFRMLTEPGVINEPILKQFPVPIHNDISCRGCRTSGSRLGFVECHVHWIYTGTCDDDFILIDYWA